IAPDPKPAADHSSASIGQLITPVVPPMPLTKFVRIQRSAPCADRRTDGRTFLSTSEGANSRAGSGRTCHRELVTVFLPESPAMTNLAITYSLRGRYRRHYRCNRLHDK